MRIKCFDKTLRHTGRCGFGDGFPLAFGRNTPKFREQHCFAKTSLANDQHDSPRSTCTVVKRFCELFNGRFTSDQHRRHLASGRLEWVHRHGAALPRLSHEYYARICTNVHENIPKYTDVYESIRKYTNVHGTGETDDANNGSRTSFFLGGVRLREPVDPVNQSVRANWLL